MRLLRRVLSRLLGRRRVPPTWVGTATIELDTEHGRAPIKGGVSFTVTEATREPER